MRILIEITHPAHVHFFRNPIRLLQDAGHEVLITSRDKDCTLDLLDRYGLEHQCLSKQAGGIGMARELLSRNRALIRQVREFRPDVMAGLGGISAAQVGWLLRVPSVVFYDTETARLQNALTYPFATRVVVPDCYQAWVPKRKTTRYRGYHELSYLHPDYFQPDRQKALEAGLDPEQDTFLLRLVSWKASHDVGLKGWSPPLLDAVVDHLRKRGRVIISAEGELPEHHEPLRYSGDPGQIHHLIAYCRACIGESATMASEAVVLGTASVYIATESRGYVDEQAERYQLAKILPIEKTDRILKAIDDMLSVSTETIQGCHQELIGGCVDVANEVASQLIETVEPL